MDISKLAFYNKPFPHIESFFEMIDCAKEFGLSAIEGFAHMELTNPDVFAAKKIYEYAEKNGISFCCFSVFSDVVGENSESETERLKGFAEVAKVLKSPFLHHTIAPNISCDALKSKNINDVFDNCILSVREIFDYCENLGIRAIYEDQAFLFNGIENFERFINNVDRDIGVVADFGNICQAEQSIIPFIEKFAEKIVHVHIKDVRPAEKFDKIKLPTVKGNYFVETEIGTGVVDIKNALALLEKIGYDGFFALEYGAPYDDYSKIKDAIDFLTNIR